MTTEECMINSSETVYIIGNTSCCYAFNCQKEITRLKYPLKDLYIELRPENFMWINNFTLVNTRYFIARKNKYEIQLKDGSLHKVFRRKWKEF